MADCRPISSEHGLHNTSSTAIDIVPSALRETMSQPRGAGQKGAAPVTDHLVRAQSPAEFFKEHVEAACVAPAAPRQRAGIVLRRQSAHRLRARRSARRPCVRYRGPGYQARARTAGGRTRRPSGPAARRRHVTVHRRLLRRQPAPPSRGRRLLHVRRRPGLRLARRDRRRARPRSSRSWPIISSGSWTSSPTSASGRR